MVPMTMVFEGRGGATKAAVAENFGVTLSGVVVGESWAESWSWVGSPLAAAEVVVSTSSRSEVLRRFLGTAEAAAAVVAVGGKKQGRRNRRRASILAMGLDFGMKKREFWEFLYQRV